jgi:hypothetical protein
MNRNRHALTLLEVLVGVSIFLIGVAPLLGLFSGQERESQFVGERLLVVNRLRSLLDLVQCRYISEHFMTPSTDTGEREYTIGGGERPLKIHERVRTRTSDQTPGLVKIEVSASWQDPTGTVVGTHVQTLERLIADPEWGSRHQGPTSRQPGPKVNDESPEGEG